MSAPLSMEEWQNRMRAQKEQERQNKNQATETLHSYKRSGLNDDEDLLRKIRLEEQQKKKEAAEILNSYRPNADGFDNNTSPRNQQPTTNNKYEGPEPVTAPSKDDPRNSIAAGAVSSMAANFNKSSPTTKEEDNANESGKTYSEASTEKAGGQGEEANSESSSSNPYEEYADAATAEQSTSNEGQPSETKENISPPEPSGDVSQSDLAADWVDVRSEELPRPETPEILAEKPLQGHATVVRLDVDFSFGLISTKTKPTLDEYMEVVEEVVTHGLKANEEMHQHVSYNPKFRPFVEDIQKDANYVDASGRENVHRLLVRAAVPVFLTNGISPKKARSGVIKALQVALRNGAFRKLSMP